MNEIINPLELLSDKINLKILKYYYKNPAITQTEISSHMSKNKMDINRRIKKLQQAEILIKEPGRRQYILSEKKRIKYRINGNFANPDYFKRCLKKMKKSNSSISISQDFSGAKINSPISQVVNLQKNEDIKPLIIELSKIITDALKEKKSTEILKKLKGKIPNLKGISEGMISNLLFQILSNLDKMPTF
jgi:DNA-binding Lrp family transcriptional regulator